MTKRKPPRPAGPDVKKNDRIIPRGAGEPLLPVPDKVTITEEDIDHAIGEWNHLFPEYTGLLEAEIAEENKSNITKKQALSYWREQIKPDVIVRYGENTLPALRESWQVYTDHLCKAGRITQKQYDTWGSPPECKG